MQFGLYPRLALTLSLLLTLAMGIMGGILLLDAEKKFSENQLDRATVQAKTLAEGSLDALVTEDYELLERWVAAVIPEKFYAYAYLAKSDGQVLAHSNNVMVARHLEAIGKLTGVMVKDKTYLGRPVKEVSYPARINDVHLANAVVAYYLDEAQFLQTETTLKIIFIIVLSLLVLLVVMLWVIRKFTRPLADLTDYISNTSISNKKFHIKDTLLHGSGEVGVLARAYESMIKRLQDAFDELSHEEDRLREKVEERTHELQVSNQELEKFSYSVSHDLRSPLRAVAGFSSIIAEEYHDKLDENGQEYLQLIQDSILKMEKLIEDMLQLARISRKELDIEEVNLSLLTTEILDRHRYAEPEREVECVIENDLVCQADRGLIIILLENLLGNAWKYSSKKEKARIEFGHRIIDDEVVYFVRDNGAGFDMRYVDRIFEAFQRLHTETEFSGSGVGLATAFRVVGRFKGKIWAESVPGEGATFYFSL